MSEKCPKIVFAVPRDNSWTFSDIFSTFFGHFVDIPFFWAVQRFARYNASVSGFACGPFQAVVGAFAITVSKLSESRSWLYLSSALSFNKNLVDISDIFYFFLLGEGERESEALGGEGGGD